MFTRDDKGIFYASLALVAAMCVVPFLVPVHRMPITSFYGEWLACALGLAALLPLVRLDLWRDTGAPVMLLFPLALSAWLAVQWMCGQAGPTGPLPAMLYLLWFAALIMLGAALRKAVGLSAAVSVLAWALLLGSELNAFAGLAQHYHWNTPFNDWIVSKNSVEVYGNLAQRNHYAAYLALGLVSGVHLYARGLLHGGLLAAAAVPLLCTMGLSGSRSAWLYLAALPLLALLLTRCRGVAEDRRWLRASLWLLAGFVLAQWLVTLPWFAPPDAARVITASERMLGGTDSARLELWSRGWHAFLQAPWLGTGMGGFTWKFYEFQAATGTAALRGTANHAHNLLIQWLAEAGIAGGLLVLAAFLFWARDLWRAAACPEDRWLFGIVAVLGIHSMLEKPLWYSYFLGILGIVFGLGAARFLAPRLPRAWRVAATAGLLAGALTLVIFFRDYRAFEQCCFPSPGTEAAGAQRARTLSALARNPLLTPYVEVALTSDISVGAEHLEQKLALNTRAMHFKPTRGIVYQQALLLAEQGNAAAAQAQFAGSMRAYPEAVADITKVLRVMAVQSPEKYGSLLEAALAGARAGRPAGQVEQ